MCTGSIPVSKDSDIQSVYANKPQETQSSETVSPQQQALVDEIIKTLEKTQEALQTMNFSEPSDPALHKDNPDSPNNNSNHKTDPSSGSTSSSGSSASSPSQALAGITHEAIPATTFAFIHPV